MARQGEKWSKKEEGCLIISYLIEKDNIFTLSRIMGRTKVAIVLRLKKLRVIREVYEARGFSELESYDKSKLNNH
mgnify:FL=1|tara:strand:+ start:1585 stop:1809 length:225 start_codon:yes stop_codon:yes gene_type:complete